MNETSIEWTDYSANPIKFRNAGGELVWGCVKCSDGCKNCYAETIAGRWNRGGPFSLQVMQKLTPFFDDKEVKLLLRSKKISGKRVFIGDMTDVFGEWVSDEILDRLFAVFALRPDVTFQVLTKRAERMQFQTQRLGHRGVGWPLPNVWLGASCENQEWADKRIPHLLATPAAVRFLSVEPMLGPVDLTPQLLLQSAGGVRHVARGQMPWDAPIVKHPAIDWVIVGGESGGNSRPCRLGWIESIVDQCKAADVPCFVKQLGSTPMSNGRVKLASRKGNAMLEWPEQFRVRQFPEEKT